MPTTKEAILGRRAYTKCLDPAFQEAYAATGDRVKREALSHVAEAWSKFDELDPEGELLLLKGMMDRIQSDPKLASTLLPQRVANAQLASLRMNHSPGKRSNTNSIRATASGLESRDMTPQSSPSKAAHTPRISVSPSKRESGSPGKLVMNPQNPHLKKMRSNQALNAEKEKELSALDEKMPGKVEPGMEHVGLLSDVLYGRWTDGLKVRWPLS
jgi:serine/threonine-protein kinase 24/25/MST4